MSIDLGVTLAQLRQRQGIKWTAFGPDVLPAWVADMDFPVAPPIHRAITATLERNDLGYAGAASVRALAEAFATRMNERFNWQADPELVMPAGNLIQALIASVASFSEAGEGVLIQTPIYYPFLKIVELQGRRLVENRLQVGPTRYEMDIDGLRHSIDKGTRLLLFCNPHNPTGRVFQRSELEQVAAAAIENDLIVVSDEIHADLTYPGNTHIPLASLGEEIAARTITITSATKAFNIAGLKCAVIHFGCRELLQRQTAFFAEHLLGTPNTLGIEATLAAWRDGDEWLNAVLCQLAGNRQTVSAWATRHLPLAEFRPPQASYLAWLDCSALKLTPRPYEFMLNDARVALSDGGEFSHHTDQFVRLNFATSPEILEQILRRMSGALQSSG